jgi:hypothetical protein
MVLGSLIASIALDTKEGPDVNDQYWANIMRDSFTCNPRFSGLMCCSTIYAVVERTSFICFCHSFVFVVGFFLEFLLIHLHFIMCGTATVIAVIFILVKLRQLYADRDFLTQMRRKDVHHRELGSTQKREEKSFNQKKRDRYCRMVALAFACTVLLLFNVVWMELNHSHLPTSPINQS